MLGQGNTYPLPADSLAAPHSHLRPSPLQPHQLLPGNTSSVNNTITYFYIMPLQSLHFYRKEDHRALKWGLSGALQLLLGAGLWLIQSLCSSSPAPSEGRSGATAMAHSSSSATAGAIPCYCGVCPSLCFCKELCWCLLKVFPWVNGFYTGHMHYTAMSCSAVTCGLKAAFSLGLFGSGSLLGYGVGNCKPVLTGEPFS